MGLVQGEQKDSDEVFNINGLTFLVPVELNKYNGFNIDFLDAPFKKDFTIRPILFSGDL